MPMQLPSVEEVRATVATYWSSDPNVAYAANNRINDWRLSLTHWVGDDVRPFDSRWSSIRRLIASLWEVDEDDFEQMYDCLDPAIWEVLLAVCATSAVDDFFLENGRYTISECCDRLRMNYRPCDNCGSCCECAICSSCDAHVDHTCSGCGECDSCCDCSICEGCGDPVDNTCSHCNQCSSCCDCDLCTRCNYNFADDVRARCEDCECCERCCSCDNRSLRSIRETGNYPAILLSERTRFNSTRKAGIEWEFNNATNSSYINRWAREWKGGIHSDGSCGWECVTPPAAGNYMLDCLEQLGGALENSSATVDKRCGIHVHVDASDLYWPDIFRLMGIYAHLEPLLYALAGQNRQSVTYSSPVGPVFQRALGSIDRKGATIGIGVDIDQGYYPSDLSNRIKRIGTQVIPKKGEGDGRYRSLNLCPWLARNRTSTKDHRKTRVKDTTIEFRMHLGTLDTDRVVEWVKLCVRLVDWISNASDREAQEMLQLSALRALVRIAPESSGWIMERIRAWRKATSRRKRVRRTVQVREGRWTCVG